MFMKCWEKSMHFLTFTRLHYESVCLKIRIAQQHLVELSDVYGVPIKTHLGFIFNQYIRILELLANSHVRF
jgi:hypothetical protein